MVVNISWAAGWNGVIFGDLGLEFLTDIENRGELEKDFGDIYCVIISKKLNSQPHLTHPHL